MKDISQKCIPDYVLSIETVISDLIQRREYSVIE